MPSDFNDHGDRALYELYRQRKPLFWKDVPPELRMTPDLLAHCPGARDENEGQAWLAAHVDVLLHPTCPIAVPFYSWYRFMPCSRKPNRAARFCWSHGGRKKHESLLSHAIRKTRKKLRALGKALHA